MAFLQIEQLIKRFGTQEALRGVSFSVDKGEIFGIIGQSGAGKSSLLRILSTLDRPTSGAIFFEGEDIARFSQKELNAYRKKIGMVFQHFNLLASKSVLHNVMFPLEIQGLTKKECKARALEVLDLVGLKEKQNRYPAHLSGGEKQRVGIARALVNQPHLLLCDEATSALDPKTTKEILHLIKNLHQSLNLTIVLITHEMEVIKQICHRAIVLEKGQVVESGLVTHLFFDPTHPITKVFLENSRHELPEDLFHKISSQHKLLRLSFRGETAGKPLISQVIKRFDVEVNILLGWIDAVQNVMIGKLVIELEGEQTALQSSLDFLSENGVHVEEMQHGQ